MSARRRSSAAESAGNRSSLRVRTKNSARLLTQILRVRSSSRAAKKASHSTALRSPISSRMRKTSANQRALVWSIWTSVWSPSRWSRSACSSDGYVVLDPVNRHPLSATPTTATRRCGRCDARAARDGLDADAVELELDLVDMVERRRVRVVTRRAALQVMTLEQLRDPRGAVARNPDVEVAGGAPIVGAVVALRERQPLEHQKRLAFLAQQRRELGEPQPQTLGARPLLEVRAAQSRDQLRRHRRPRATSPRAAGRRSRRAAGAGTSDGIGRRRCRGERERRPRSPRRAAPAGR